MARGHAEAHESLLREWLRGISRAERGAALTRAAEGHGLRTRAVEQKGAKRNRGTWYTPPELVDAILDRALTPGTLKSGRVCDPACGSGHFLVAVAQRMKKAGRAAASIRAALWGTDIDPRAVALTRVRLQEVCGGTPAQWRKTIRWADALASQTWREEWCTFDLVVGNPPFVGRVRGGSVASRTADSRMLKQQGDYAPRYANVACGFLVLGIQLASETGTVALVLPLSLLAAKDAHAARQFVSRNARMEWCLLPPTRAFGGGVGTAVPVLRRRARTSSRVRVQGVCGGAPAREAILEWCAHMSAGNWSKAIAAAEGTPTIEFTPGATRIGDVALVTADFRQHFYGLRGKVKEDVASTATVGWAPVVTAGSIDAAHNSWGTRPVTLHGRRYLRPIADTAALRRDRVLGKWVDARLAPKVILATQTRAIEAWVDEKGAVLPCTPLVSIVPVNRRDVWKVAAAVLSPPLAVHAWWHHAGAALSSKALKLSAANVREFKMPSRGRDWNAAAKSLRDWQQRADRGLDVTKARKRFADMSMSAYQVPSRQRQPLYEWWLAAVANKIERRSVKLAQF